MTRLNGFKKLATLATLAVAASFAQASTVNLVNNGSFEAPGVSAGNWRIFNSIPGWVVGPRGVEVRNQHKGLAQEGGQFVELDTTRNSWISQVIPTNVGQNYTLSFWYSPRIQHPSANDNRIVAFVDGEQISSLAAAGSVAHNWQRTLHVFNATTTSIELKFAAAGVSNGLGGSLDNVSLTATPLPGAALLFATALAGYLGFSKRRKV